MGIETYRDNSRISSQLDDKAQKTVTLAGIFVAASFAFLKPGSSSGLKAVNTVVATGIMSIVTASIFLVCLGICLSVMWTRSYPPPVNFETIKLLNKDLERLAAESITEDVQRNYYQDVSTLWGGVLAVQRRVNEKKGKLLFAAQITLGLGMLSAVGLLVSLIFSAIV